MKSLLLACTALAGTAFLNTQAIAQSDQPRPTSQEQIETVIVTGNRPPLNAIPLKSTFTESTITPEAILNITPSPAMTVQTLLATQPSIYATVGATNGMETDIKFRSFVDGEFGETLAGVPLNDIFNGGVTYQADNRNNALVITRDLDSVQIYRGINNPAVNTYNSLGGTINYILRQPKDDFGGDVGVDGGSFNTLDYHATLDTGDLDGIKQTFSVERDFSSGWLENTPDWNDNLYWAANAELPEHTTLFSYFLLNKNRGDAPQFIPFNVLEQDWSFQWPASTYLSSNDDTNYLGIFGFKSDILSWIHIEDEGYAGDNNYQRVSFSNPAYPGPYFIDDQGSATAFWLSYGPPTLYNPATVFPYSLPQAYGLSDIPGQGCKPHGVNFDLPDCAFAGTDYHFYGYNAALYGDRLQANIDLPFNAITTGGDFNQGQLHSREYWYGAFNMPKIIGYNDAWDENDSRQMWSAYIQDDIHLFDDRLHITPGIKFIHSTIKDNDALGFFYVPPGSLKAHEHFLSPTVGVNYEVTPDFTFYGAYGKNTKFPDVTALYNELGYGGAVPPVAAQPEEAEDYELGARYRWDTLLAELNVYQENFTHILFSIPVPGGYGASEQINGGSERFRGVELQLTDEFGEFWIGNWKGYLNASYNEATCSSAFTSPNADTGNGCNVGQQLANVPRYLLNAGLIWDYDGWHVDLQGHYVGLQEVLDYGTGLPVNPLNIELGQPTKIPDYFLVNLGIVKVIPVTWAPANAIRLALHVDNLFDKRYYSEAETNYRITNPNTGAQATDFYGITGEPRAVFASVSVYFN